MSTPRKHIWKQNKMKDSWAFFHSWQAILLAGVCVWLISIFPPASDIVKHMSLEIGVLLVLIFGGIFLWMTRVKKCNDPEKIYGLILFSSLVLRAFVAIVINYQETNHDVGAFSGTGGISGTGFFGYIEYIYQNGSLPNFDPRTAWSFYNPPAFPILAALLLKLTKALGVEDPYCYEALQSIPFVFSALTIWTMGKLLKEFSMKENHRNLLLAVLAFYPYFHISGATLTNDAMSTYFAILGIWLAVRWYRQQTLGNIALLALALGLAMFTKLNAGLFGFGIAFLFVYALVTQRENFKNYLVQFPVFLAISVPLAFYYPVKNKLLYDMPLFYIQQLEPNNPQMIQGVGAFGRLLFPNVGALLQPFSMLDPMVENNVWLELIRSSLFDERHAEDMGLSVILATALFWLAVVAAIVTFVALVEILIRRKSMPFWQRGFLLACYLAMVISSVVFCFKEPFVCTMHYRYVSVLMVFPLICAGIWLQESGKHHPTVRKASLLLGRGLVILSIPVVLWVAIFARIAEM